MISNKIIIINIFLKNLTDINIDYVEEINKKFS